MMKLSYEKTAEELDASVKMDVDKFFSHCWATSRAKRNREKPHLCIPPEKLRRTIDAHQTKQHADRKKHSPLSDYDRTISKSIQAEKKKEKMARMGVAQLREQAQQSVPPLLVGNQYGSNMSMLDQIPDDVQMVQFETFIHESGLS
jgi:hypothetical protein